MSDEVPHIVIIGAGFAGLAAAEKLRGAPVRVTIVDKQNHHLFQPLLYQVATAGLSPADVAAPIRSIVRNARNTSVLLDCVVSVDTRRKIVALAGGDALEYDHLIVATGARHSYFGHDDWETSAPGLKTIDDALLLRRNILLALERAEVAHDTAERDRLLTFVVIGGGPTGVEMAGAIAELARKSVSMDFRRITPHCSRVVLIDAGDRLLKAFPERLSTRAREGLERLGVEVRCGVHIDSVHADGVMIGREMMPASTIVWAAGVVASPAAKWLGVEPDRAGRIEVGRDLQVPGIADVYALGDTAACANEKGELLPGIAAVAKQQGRHAAKTILSRLRGRTCGPFRYRSFGTMATIGRSDAVADFGWMKASGLFAWILWCTIHIYFLVNFRNRLSVGLAWGWSYLTFQRNARLITGLVDGRPPVVAEDMHATSAAA